MKHALKLSIVLLSLLLLNACNTSNQPETLLETQKISHPNFYIDESKLPFDSLFGSTPYWGIHNKAGYQIEVPANWNGDLVVWAHGYRETNPPLELELKVDMPPLREWFIANGYAWAASSYSKNDYDVAQGAKDTHALTKFFNGLVGKPKHTYIAGVSMGGHVTAVSIEQWPNTYDGALPACGVLGDYELFDYLLDFNLVAQAQAGITAQFPPASNYLTTTVPTIKASLELYPGYFPFALNQAGENYKAALKYLSGGQRPLYDEGFLFWTGFTNNALFGLGMSDGTLARSPGVAVDNSSTVYQFDADPTLSPAEQMLNNTILRISQDLQGRHRAGLANVPPISGKITVPVLTLHTLGDLFVPFSMEQIYAERVAVNGASDLLVQRAIRDVGHCSFTGYELVTAFEDLVNWVENDTKPLGDNVTDPIAVADPNFGCAFTQGTHPTIEAIRPYIPLPACP